MPKAKIKRTPTKAQRAEDRKRYECGNCEKVFKLEDLEEYRDFWSRVQPGEIMPHGDCPDCGAFCYEKK